MAPLSLSKKSTPPTAFTSFLSPKTPTTVSPLYLRYKQISSRPICRIGGRANFNSLFNSPLTCTNDRRKSKFNTQIKCDTSESPYEILGVPPSSTPLEIKKAYRRLTIKYHPAVNKKPDAKQKFLRIKRAYITLLNSDSQRKDGSENLASNDSFFTAGGNKHSNDEDELCGIDHFFKDLHGDFKNWETSDGSQEQPNLAEQLANITDADKEKENHENPEKGNASPDYETKRNDGSARNDTLMSRIKDNLKDIGAAITQLKRKLGL